MAGNCREQVSNGWKDLPGFLRELQSTGGCTDAAGLPPEAASLTAFREPANQSTNFSSSAFLIFLSSYFIVFSSPTSLCASRASKGKSNENKRIKKTVSCDSGCCITHYIVTYAHSHFGYRTRQAKYMERTAWWFFFGYIINQRLRTSARRICKKEQGDHLVTR